MAFTERRFSQRSNPILSDILIIDDDVMDCLILKVGLRDFVRSIGVSHTLKDAIVKVATVHYEFIILDLKFGLDNGLDYLDDLIAVSKGAKIIICTGAQKESLDKLIASKKIVGVVEKGINFVNTIKDIMNIKHSLDSIKASLR